MPKWGNNAFFSSKDLHVLCTPSLSASILTISSSERTSAPTLLRDSNIAQLQQGTNISVSSSLRFLSRPPAALTFDNCHRSSSQGAELQAHRKVYPRTVALQRLALRAWGRTRPWPIGTSGRLQLNRRMLKQGQWEGEKEGVPALARRRRVYRTAAMQENGGEIWRRGCNIKKRLNSAEHILADGFRATLLCIQSLHTAYLLPPVNPVMTVSSLAVPNWGMRTWQCRPTLLSLACLLPPSLQSLPSAQTAPSGGYTAQGDTLGTTEKLTISCVASSPCE